MLWFGFSSQFQLHLLDRCCCLRELYLTNSGIAHIGGHNIKDVLVCGPKAGGAKASVGGNRIALRFFKVSLVQNGSWVEQAACLSVSY